MTMKRGLRVELEVGQALFYSVHPEVRSVLVIRNCVSNTLTPYAMDLKVL